MHSSIKRLKRSEERDIRNAPRKPFFFRYPQFIIIDEKVKEKHFITLSFCIELYNKTFFIFNMNSTSHCIQMSPRVQPYTGRFFHIADQYLIHIPI